MVKVSVLLTSYNHADYLKKSIQSILDQTYRDFELIIIDDCSVDNSWEIIKSFKDKRIIKKRNKVNKGSNFTRELVETFKGKYFAIAHCDDYWKKDKLEKQIEYMERHKNVAACFTWVKLVDEQDQQLNPKLYTNFNIKFNNRYELLNHLFYKGNCLCHPSVLMRKDVQLKREIFPKGLKSLPDLYKWVRLLLTDDIHIIPEELTYFRVRLGGENTSGVNLENIIRYSYEITKVIELYRKIETNDFLKIFPNAKKYKKQSYFNIDYALARICIDEIKSNNFIKFGLDIIYELLNNEKSREELHKYYDYSVNNFTRETSDNDIFYSVNLDNIQYSTLYYSFEDNFNEENKISKKTLINQNGEFQIVYGNINRRVSHLRIDPDEGKLRCYSDIKIYVNGKKVKFKPNQATMIDEKMYFYHTDPQFIIDYIGVVKDVFIVGRTSMIPIADIIAIKKTKQSLISKVKTKLTSKS